MNCKVCDAVLRRWEEPATMMVLGRKVKPGGLCDGCARSYQLEGFFSTANREVDENGFLSSNHVAEARPEGASSARSPETTP